MNPSLCIYEDRDYWQLYPLSLTRLVFELRCGIFTLVEKLVRHFPGYPVRYCVRNEFIRLAEEKHPDVLINKFKKEDTYFINGRFLLKEEVPKELSGTTVFVAKGEIVGAFVKQKDIGKVKQTSEGVLDDRVFSTYPKLEIKGEFIRYPWDLIRLNAQEIIEDFKLIGSGGHILGKVYPNVTLLDQSNIYLAPGAKVYPGVVINGESGPVYIGEGTEVMPNAVIEGPGFIGKNSRIKIGAKIYEGTSIGEVCKIGGEVEESIIHAFSNKQHEGFLGHAYLGEWVNLGADTNNSDLKNNYSTVKVSIYGRQIDTGSQFVGLFMGDHSKSGINTMFNTGTVIGVMCNIFGADYPPKFVPSFTWGGVGEKARYDFDKAIEAARRVMQRRNKALSDAQVTLLKQIYERSLNEPI